MSTLSDISAFLISLDMQTNGLQGWGDLNVQYVNPLGTEASNSFQDIGQLLRNRNINMQEKLVFITYLYSSQKNVRRVRGTGVTLKDLAVLYQELSADIALSDLRMLGLRKNVLFSGSS